MSLYAKYVKERQNVDTIEEEWGFVTYRFLQDACYIMDIYVVPEQRNTRKAHELADRVALIARDSGYDKLVGSVDPALPSATASIGSLLYYGMSVVGYDAPLLWFEKDL